MELVWIYNLPGIYYFCEENQKNSGDSFTTRLTTKVLDNLQIEFTDVHIRYEDDVTNPKVRKFHTNSDFF
jgi:hypothetical protein